MKQILIVIFLAVCLIGCVSMDFSKAPDGTTTLHWNSFYKNFDGVSATVDGASLGIGKSSVDASLIPAVNKLIERIPVTTTSQLKPINSIPSTDLNSTDVNTGKIIDEKLKK